MYINAEFIGDGVIIEIGDNYKFSIYDNLIKIEKYSQILDYLETKNEDISLYCGGDNNNSWNMYLKENNFYIQYNISGYGDSISIFKMSKEVAIKMFKILIPEIKKFYKHLEEN